jgi:Fe-S-cluster containining protein
MDWEKNMFPKENVIPLMAFFDIKNNEVINYVYTLDVDSCPNVDDENKCIIYDKRPIFCRSYPCEGLGPENIELKPCSAELSKDEFNKQLGHQNEDGKILIETNELMKKLYGHYGENYLYALSTLELSKYIINNLISLEQNNKIKLAKKGYDLNYLIPRMEKSKSIG